MQQQQNIRTSDASVDERIVEAGLRLLNEKDIATISTKELAEGAGVSVKTLYNRFGSLAGALQAAIQHNLREMYNHVNQAKMPTGVDGLIFVAQELQQFCVDRDRIMRNSFTTLMHANDVAGLEKISTDYYKRLIREIAARKEIDEKSDIDSVARLIFLALTSTYDMWVCQRVQSNELLSLFILDLCKVLLPITADYTRVRLLEVQKEAIETLVKTPLDEETR